MDSVSLLLSLSVLPHSIMLSLEGALLASKDFKFQSNSYLLMGILFVSYQVWVIYTHVFCDDDDNDDDDDDDDDRNDGDDNGNGDID